MALIEITDPFKTVEITAVVNIPSSDDWVSGFVKQLDNLNLLVPLASFLFENISGDDYRYEFVAQDDREWKQVLKMPGETEASMTFEVDTFWLKSEFTGHRPIRDAVIALAENYGCDRIEVTWVP